MVGGLKYYKHDPNGRGRGAGFYYHRGNGIYSLYSQERDAKQNSSTKIKKGNWRYMHTGDGTYRDPKSYKKDAYRATKLVRTANKKRKV